MSPHIKFCQQNVPMNARCPLTDRAGTVHEKRYLQHYGTYYTTLFLIINGEL